MKSILFTFIEVNFKQISLTSGLSYIKIKNKNIFYNEGL